MQIDPTPSSNSEPLQLEIPELPFMPEQCIEKLTHCLESSKSYLEYGSGGSTSLARSIGVPNIYSVESDKNWLDRIGASKHNSIKKYRGNHICKWIDIGPTGDWGYPLNIEKHMDYWQYPSAPWLSDKRAVDPDTVLIDGRFRVACFFLTMMHARPGTTILFDDYNDRNHYHQVEKLATPTETVDRMAIFVVPKQVALDTEQLKIALSALQDVR